MEGVLDLNEHLIKQPAATVFVRARGDSMTGAGIHDGDLLVVDRSIEAADGRIVIAALNGELTVKRLAKNKGTPRLEAENPAYGPIEFNEEDSIHLWGVVTNVIHRV
jgi:DNA polymerase V